MKRKHMDFIPEAFPQELRAFVSRFSLYDSSCSPESRVWMLDGKERFFLKRAAAGTLQTEAEMTRYFHRKGLGAEVLRYLSGEQDWLLTRAVKGEDCLHQDYLADPKRLADTMAQMLYDLHHRAHTLCPVQNHTERYIARARENYAAGRYDTSLFPDNWGYSSAEEAWAVVESGARYLKTDTLLHGDYCLPNIMLDNWKFSGFIDLDTAGVGDKHVDLFWGIWSLQFNLKTDCYRERFLDAYGRENIQEELFRTVAAIEVFG